MNETAIDTRPIKSNAGVVIDHSREKNRAPQEATSPTVNVMNIINFEASAGFIDIQFVGANEGTRDRFPFDRC